MEPIAIVEPFIGNTKTQRVAYISRILLNQLKSGFLVVYEITSDTILYVCS